MTNPSSPTSQPLFSPGEWDQFRRDDAMAARFVVGLMIGIFVMGLAGYIAVCFWVA